jgi:hypothetical protein
VSPYETVNVTELEGLQSELERLHDRCDRGLVQLAEMTTALAAIDRRTRAALPPDTDLFRLYDSQMKESTDYWRKTLNGYVSPQDCVKIGRRIAILRSVLKEVETDFLSAESAQREQIYFQGGELYRARQGFYHLLKRAAKRIDIADPYLDPDVFDFVEILDGATASRLLTGVPKPLFTKQLHELQAIGKLVEARTNDRNHDRFVILDGSAVWHLGASINGLGKKAFMMNKVVDEGERARIVADFEDWWSAGATI